MYSVELKMGKKKEKNYVFFFFGKIRYNETIPARYELRTVERLYSHIGTQVGNWYLDDIFIYSVYHLGIAN